MRLEELKKAKERGTTGIVTDVCPENGGIMVRTKHMFAARGSTVYRVHGVMIFALYISLLL